MQKRKVNIYKPRLSYLRGIRMWACSSFMNDTYGNTPEEAYSKWKEKELLCSGKRRLDNVVGSTLRNLDKFNEENEIVEWDILKKDIFGDIQNPKNQVKVVFDEKDTTLLSKLKSWWNK